MIELNKNKLIPGVDTSWGDITGDISKQSDLMSTLSSYATESWVSGKNYLTASSLKTINNQSIVGSGNINIEASVPDYYATKAWVSEQGYLTSETLPSDLATESWVSSQGYLTSVPDTFATKAWVSEQGYLTSETLPSDLATESWVSSQGYLTSTSLKTINSQSLVGEGDIEIGGLTPEQEAAIEPLVETSGGVLYTNEFERYIGKYMPSPLTSQDWKQYIYNIDGEVFIYLYNYLYRWDPDNYSFSNYVYIEGSNNYCPVWKDNSGRYYQGGDIELDFENRTATSINLDIAGYAYYGNRHTIWKGQYGVYNLGSSPQKFNETTQKFESFTVNVPSGYSVGSLCEILSRYGVEYDGHYISHENGEMYELKEYEDHIDIIIVDNPYYPLTADSGSITLSYGFVFNVSGDLFYLKESNSFKLVDGEWVAISCYMDNGNPFYFTYIIGRGVVYENFIIGFLSYENTGRYDIMNMSDTMSNTYWVPAAGVAVDLNSDQFIKGSKSFSSANVENLNDISVFNCRNINTFHLYNNTTEANKILLSVEGEFSVNGKDIATVDDCILNKQYIPYGGKVVNVMQPNMDPYYYNYITTHTGRLFCEYNGSSYEFNGTTWNMLSSRLLPNGSDVYSPNVIKSANCTYYVAGPNTYLWNDTNSQFELISSTGPGGDRWELWICGGDVLRMGSTYKLVESGGTYSWDDTDPVNSYISGMYHIINGTVYLLSQSNGYVYTYDEATKTYTQIGRYHTWNDRSFSAYGQIFWPWNGDRMYMLDVSKIDGNPETYIDTVSTIPYTQYDFFYGPYNNRLYLYLDYSNFGYCYGESYELPEVPASNGTYVLKAVRTGSAVTYSWVAE